MRAPILTESQPPPPAAVPRHDKEMSWQTLVLSPQFLKAVVLAFAVVAAVLIIPLEDYAFKYAPFLATVPRAAECIKALVAAAAITFLRPPEIDAE